MPKFYNNLAILYFLISFSSLISSADLPNYNDIVSHSSSDETPSYIKSIQMHIKRLISSLRWDTEEDIADSLDELLNSQESKDIRSFSSMLNKILKRMKIDGQCSIHWAAYSGYNKVINFLHDYGKFSLNIKDDDGNTPLHLAQKLSTVRILINEDAEMNARNNRLETPLHKAAERGNYEIASLLLDSGAIPNLRDVDGQTPADIASKNGDIELKNLIQSYYCTCCTIL